MLGVVPSTERQLLIAGLVAACALWMGISTAATMVALFAPSKGDQEVAQTQAKYERWIADRDARLNSAVAQISASGGSMEDIANSVEKRNDALAMLLTD